MPEKKYKRFKGYGHGGCEDSVSSNSSDCNSDECDCETYNAAKPRQSIYVQRAMRGKTIKSARSAASTIYQKAQEKRRSTISDFRKMFKEDTRKEFKVKQVWICGPPIMSDNFDKDFQSLINERIDEMQRKLDEAMMNRYAKQKVMAPLDTTMAMNEKQDTDGRTYELDLETQYDII